MAKDLFEFISAMSTFLVNGGLSNSALATTGKIGFTASPSTTKGIIKTLH